MSTIQQPLYLEPGLAGSPMTPEEFDAVTDCDREFDYQLINGVLVVTPPPDEGERFPNDLLGHLLRAYGQEHPQGRVLNSTAQEQTIATGVNRRRVDRAIWAGFDKLPNPRRTLPTIAVEFVSRSRRDRHRDYEVKRDEYLAAGILEYWVIDRHHRCMTVFRQRIPAFEELVIVEGQTYSTPLLPGFELPLAKLLAEADAVADDSDPQ